jgi:cysteine-rich repeat protein
VKNKRGMSDVIMTVLLILIAILAVFIIAMVFLRTTTESSQEIESRTLCFSAIIQTEKCTFPEGNPKNPTVLLSYQGSGTISGVKILFENASESETIDEIGTLSKFQTLISNPVLNINAEQASAYPIVQGKPCTISTNKVPCIERTCGNGETELGEECDDGNREDCDSCSSSCLSKICGNNREDCGEQCDDGEDNNNNCDPGYDNPSQAGCCDESCGIISTRYCGDGEIESGEEFCDPGQHSECPSDCTPELLPMILSPAHLEEILDYSENISLEFIIADPTQNISSQSPRAITSCQFYWEKESNPDINSGSRINIPECASLGTNSDPGIFSPHHFFGTINLPYTESDPEANFVVTVFISYPITDGQEQSYAEKTFLVKTVDLKFNSPNFGEYFNASTIPISIKSSFNPTSCVFSIQDSSTTTPPVDCGPATPNADSFFYTDFNIALSNQHFYKITATVTHPALGSKIIQSTFALDKCPANIMGGEASRDQETDLSDLSDFLPRVNHQNNADCFATMYDCGDFFPDDRIDIQDLLFILENYGNDWTIVWGEPEPCTSRVT